MSRLFKQSKAFSAVNVFPSVLKNKSSKLEKNHTIILVFNSFLDSYLKIT